MILAPEAPLRRATNTEVFCGHRPIAGLFYICVGSVILYTSFARIFVNSVDYVISAVFTVFGLTILIMGFIGALKRFEISIKLTSRTYVIKKGFFPKLRIVRGFLNDLRWLTVSTRFDFGAADRQILIWIISLDFKNLEHPVSIFEHPNKEEVFRRLESLAVKLNVPIHDETGQQT